jgi:ribosomal protein S18 acetylase RimI-like enzyme
VLVLRAAEPGDAGAVADVYLRSRHQLVAFAPLAHPDDDVRMWIQRQLIPSGQVTVAVKDGGVKGMLSLSMHEGCGWIDHLYVDPDWVGKGIGSALLNHALSSLVKPIRLFTFQANTLARHFYESRGFRAVAFTDGARNEESCPDMLYEYS